MNQIAGGVKATEGEVKPFLVRLPAQEHEQLRLAAAITDHSMNELVVRAVRDLLAGSLDDETFQAAAARVRDRYRLVLDKLADM